MTAPASDSIRPCDCCGAPAEIEAGDCCDGCMEAFHEMDVAEILKARRKQPGVKRRVNRGYYGEPVCPWCRTEIPHVTCDCARCDSMVCDSCGHALPRAYNRVLNCDIGWAPDLTCAECNAELAAESGTRISAAAGTK